jgi:beta-glucosidase-like glycosyl hydrolase
VTLARLVLPALRWKSETGFAHEEPAIAAALELGVGGFMVFGGTAEALRALTADLVRRAGRPLLLAADLERGAGQQFDGLTQFPPPMALASLGSLDAVEWAAAVTAREARGVGLNWVFAPVADLDATAANPIVQTRAFGGDPVVVSECVRAWVEGCQAAGALACAKHYPGHGRTVTDSHIGLPVVDASAELLEREDAAPFRAAMAGGVASLMTAHVAYPALDPSGAPATLSAPILDRLRRREGYDGLVVTDALIMDGALVGRSESAAAVEALGAGADILLYPSDTTAIVAALEAAVADGTLPAARVAEAGARYARALARADTPVPEAGPAPYAGAPALADAVLARGLARGAEPALRAPLDLRVLDDDLGGPYPASPSDHTRDTLRSLGVPLGPGGSRVVLVFSEPRAWKGRSGLAPELRTAAVEAAGSADLVVLFGHPRLVEDIAGKAPVLVAWHRQRLMQEAAARWLAARVRPAP